MNYQKLIEENVPNYWEEFLYEGLFEPEDSDPPELAAEVKFLQNLNFEWINAERSSESEHTSYYFRFKLDGKFFELRGSYSSYGGVHVNCPYDFYEVVPVEKTIIVYEAKK